MQTSALIAPDCNQRPARAGLHSDQRFVTPLPPLPLSPIPSIIRRIDVNKIIVGDCERVMATWPWNSVDLVVSSPPYDSMRSYRSGQRWHFLGVAYQLQRVLKPGGVLVWIVADETVNGSETGTSLNQALHFRELGLNLHDTMIWTKYLPGLMGKRYTSCWEYMFVLSKGEPKTFNPIMRKNKTAGTECRKNQRTKNGVVCTGHMVTKDYSIEENVWRIQVGGTNSSKHPLQGKHPAVFPEKLASQHIATWSNPGDLVCDPFSGSGTTCAVAARMGRRYVGIDLDAEYCRNARVRIRRARAEAV